MNKLDTTPYKGVRDFYPKEMQLQKYLFDTMRTACEKFGYIEYSASPLEPAELYRAKSGEEIVNDQTYTFTDRGNREVTLRPEMTPTVARMVAGRRRELSFPLRWYSIPNLFRYENPQRGRLREHYQLNVDVFGISDLSAEREIISVASSIMKAFGATEKDFTILINSRQLMNDFFKEFFLSPSDIHNLSKLIDKKEKLSAETFTDGVRKFLGDATETFISRLSSPETFLKAVSDENENKQRLLTCMNELRTRGMTNVSFSPTLMRGFDYYTDIVFEIFDTNPENTRSLFGGGRYDNLTTLFTNDNIPAVGFGMGDVTLADFLATHNLLPTYSSEADVAVVWGEEEIANSARDIIDMLRENNVCVIEYGHEKNMSDFYHFTEKNNIPSSLHISKELLMKHEVVLKKTTQKGSDSVQTISSREGIEELKKRLVENRK